MYTQIIESMSLIDYICLLIRFTTLLYIFFQIQFGDFHLIKFKGFTL